MSRGGDERREGCGGWCPLGGLYARSKRGELQAEPRKKPAGRWAGRGRGRGRGRRRRWGCKWWGLPPFLQSLGYRWVLYAFRWAWLIGGIGEQGDRRLRGPVRWVGVVISPLLGVCREVGIQGVTSGAFLVRIVCNVHRGSWDKRLNGMTLP